MLKVFVGFDERQIVSFTTLQQSIHEHATKPVAVSPLILRTLPITRRGLTPFTFSRFLVPWLCDYRGAAIFMDADMLLVSDINALLDEIRDDTAVSVVSSLEKYEQTSFMLFNCEHPDNKKLTPEYIEETTDNLHGLAWTSERNVGDLPAIWNQLVGYQPIDPTQGNLHFTMGVPVFPETSSCDGAELWNLQADKAMSAITWPEIMGPSVHAIEIDGVKLPRYVWDFERQQPSEKHFELVKKLVLEHHQRLAELPTE